MAEGFSVSAILFLSVFLIAACGLIYELIASTLASYLLGDSVLQFSTVIGTYLFAMGIGSWLSKFLHGSLVARFVGIELMVGVVGGFSSSVLFLAFAYIHAFELALYLVVIFTRDTRYQRIVVTRWKDDLRLFLSSHLQFSSRDEYRYHESLVHPGLSALPNARRALVLGGGDGLAVRELLKYPNLESITLVDLDPEMTRMFTDHPLLAPPNGYS